MAMPMPACMSMHSVVHMSMRMSTHISTHTSARLHAFLHTAEAKERWPATADSAVLDKLLSAATSLKVVLAQVVLARVVLAQVVLATVYRDVAQSACVRTYVETCV